MPKFTLVQCTTAIIQYKSKLSYVIIVRQTIQSDTVHARVQVCKHGRDWRPRINDKWTLMDKAIRSFCLSFTHSHTHSHTHSLTHTLTQRWWCSAAMQCHDMPLRSNLGLNRRIQPINAVSQIANPAINGQPALPPKPHDAGTVTNKDEANTKSGHL